MLGKMIRLPFWDLPRLFFRCELLAVSFREWYHPKLLSHVNRWVGQAQNGQPSDQVIRSVFLFGSLSNFMNSKFLLTTLDL